MGFKLAAGAQGSASDRTSGMRCQAALLSTHEDGYRERDGTCEFFNVLKEPGNVETDSPKRVHSP